MTIRQDAWSKDEDLLLAETVIRYIREGRTQMKAFQEVGKQLSRTPQACGFRWNANLRKQYTKAIELAKKDRKNLNGSLNTDGTLSGNLKASDKKLSSFDAVIDQLEQLKGEFSIRPHAHDSPKKDIEELRRKVDQYESFLDEVYVKIQDLRTKN